MIKSSYTIYPAKYFLWVENNQKNMIYIRQRINSLDRSFIRKVVKPVESLDRIIHEINIGNIKHITEKGVYAINKIYQNNLKKGYKKDIQMSTRETNVENIIEELSKMFKVKINGDHLSLHPYEKEEPYNLSKSDISFRDIPGIVMEGISYLFNRIKNGFNLNYNKNLLRENQTN